MIRKNVKWFIALVLIVLDPANAEYIKTDTMNKVEAQFNKVLQRFKPEDCLGLWDVDMVLTQPDDPHVQMPNVIEYFHALKDIVSTLTPEQKEVMYNLATISSLAILVEQGTSTIISNLANQGLPMIALTASLTGKLGHIDNIETWRYETLKSLGIDFSGSFPAIDTMEFREIPPFLGHYPVFKKGILSTNGQARQGSKGEALIAFLKQFVLQPRIIVFVDDREYNLQEVQTALLQHNPKIEFIGIHYTGADNVSVQKVSEEAFKAHWLKFANQAKKIAKVRLKAA